MKKIFITCNGSLIQKFLTVYVIDLNQYAIEFLPYLLVPIIFLKLIIHILLAERL